MKRFELTITKDGLFLHREVEERMTGKQKYYIILTLISCATACAVVLGFYNVLT